MNKVKSKRNDLRTALATGSALQEKVSLKIQEAIAAHIKEYSKYVSEDQIWGKGALHARLLPAIVSVLPLSVADTWAEIQRLRDEREWLQFVVNFVRLPLGIAPDVSNFDREKILAALDAALSSPNIARQTDGGNITSTTK